MIELLEHGTEGSPADRSDVPWLDDLGDLDDLDDLDEEFGAGWFPELVDDLSDEVGPADFGAAADAGTDPVAGVAGSTRAGLVGDGS